MLHPFNPTVLVLAAGYGRRFAQSGGTTHKLDALLGDVAVLDRVLRSVVASGLPYHVVRPLSALSPEMDGMGHSIARGVAATADADGWLILPGDLPLVRPQSLMAVAHSLTNHAVVVPQCGDQQGHPVGFDRTCLEALLQLQGDTGASAIVRGHRQAGTAHSLQLDDPGIAIDIDTCEDLARVQALLASGYFAQEASDGKR
ncbi:nucleotidyltransferase family protein [Comamonas piscis]|uniref:Nucleotidyltransferase family protein n=1 Tax=Comamonas piscis TaxID=1562974 RepID=A0A7G5EGY1_9BURK|nr:nucleotidyltransferase family protein [Comamonas piscis]QMV73256.1 nucleotidyltransferase family protein [Comamonas piscis]WSO36051.1 nucleotidyltransferase family protein [Comamonas piscis]